MFVEKSIESFTFDGQLVKVEIEAILQEDALELLSGSDLSDKNAKVRQYIAKYVKVLEGPSLDKMFKYFYFQPLLAAIVKKLVMTGTIPDPATPNEASDGSPLVSSSVQTSLGA